jgi:hypothetical protein
VPCNLIVGLALPQKFARAGQGPGQWTDERRSAHQRFTSVRAPKHKVQRTASVSATPMSTRPMNGQSSLGLIQGIPLNSPSKQPSAHFLPPPATAVVAAATEDQNKHNDDDDRGAVHVALRQVPASVRLSRSIRESSFRRRRTTPSGVSRIRSDMPRRKAQPESGGAATHLSLINIQSF